MKTPENFNPDPKLEYFVSHLKKDLETRIAWIQRKEVAIWSATALYLAALTYSFTFFFDNYSTFIQVFSNCGLFISIIIALVVFGIIIFAFVHAHFGSIYFSNSLFQTVSQLISKILEENLTYDEVKNENQDFNISKKRIKDEDFAFPSFLHRRIEERLTINQLYTNSKLRIFKLIFFLITLQWGMCGSKLKSGTVKQEASVYSLFFFANLIYIILVFIVLFC